MYEELKKKQQEVEKRIKANDVPAYADLHSPSRGDKKEKKEKNEKEKRGN